MMDVHTMVNSDSPLKRPYTYIWQIERLDASASEQVNGMTS